jgi:hypothetical protein
MPYDIFQNIFLLEGTNRVILVTAVTANISKNI